MEFKQKGYIDLGKVAVLPTCSELVRDILTRVHDQPFTTAQIIELVRQEPAAEGFANIPTLARRVIREGIAAGRIEVLEPPGTSRLAPGKYRMKVTK